jgi:glycosyltransferase involved in cell wall biosynthesis
VQVKLAGPNMTAQQSNSAKSKLLSVVVIGLNEEEQLSAALQSVITGCPEGYALEIFYVDSGSCDRSVEIASQIAGVEVMHLNDPRPSAAKARNAGLRRARGEFVQLLDGDSVLQPGWLSSAVEYLKRHEGVVCVFGHCLEMYPDQSIYMRVCGLDWHVSPGEYRLSGGNAMWRRAVFDQVGLFDEALRLGEEPDLCYRVRQQGGRIFCIDKPMVKHDLGMGSFAQYWQRAENSGKAYVRVASRYWRNPEKLWLYETVRNFIEPTLWGMIVLGGTWFAGPLGGLGGLVGWWLLRGLRTAVKVRARTSGWRDAALYGLHAQFIRLPVAIGQIKALSAHRQEVKG